MIRFTKNGVALDAEDWGGALPIGKGIRVTFDKGGAIWVSREFLERAMSLLEHDDDKPRPKRNTDNGR